MPTERAKKSRQKKKEIAIIGHDLAAAGDKAAALAELCAVTLRTARLKSEMLLRSNLALLQKRYQAEQVGSVGDGLFFFELGRQDGLDDYYILLARLPAAVEWSAIDGKKIRLLWSFGFHPAADRQFVVDFTVYLSQLLLDPGVWAMLMGPEPMAELAGRLEKYIGLDIQTELAIKGNQTARAIECCRKALALAPQSSRTKTRLAQASEMAAAGKKALQSYRDGK